MDYIEKDALASTPEDVPRAEHAHEDLKSFIATPRMDQTMWQKFKGLFVDELKPGMRIIHKEGDSHRYMFLVTSNSYEDRENETITTKALEEYEASCFPGEGLFYCDNPLVYWHDDDVPMGEIIAVNVSGPFLTELVKELDTPIAHILWDIAEKTENAGVSHRFGYLEKDRDPDGTFHRIFKQETTWLPDRSLAANGMTYAGVIGMASPQSDAWLDEQLEKIAGIKNAASKIHAKTGEIEKELAIQGTMHKAAKPPMTMPPKAAAPANPPAPDASGNVAVDPMTGEVEDAAETEAEGGIEEPPPMDPMQFMTFLTQMYQVFQDMVDAQMGMMDNQMGMMKELTELKELNVSEKAISDKAGQTIEQRLAELSAGLAEVQKKLSLQPRSVTQQRGGDPETVKAVINSVVDNAEKSRIEEEMVDSPLFGKVKPSPDYKKIMG